VVFPYILYQLFLFVAPALRAHERKHSVAVIVYSSLLFYLGVALDYFLIFPLSFRFLATYQVAGSVNNLIELSSYTGTLLMLSLLFGIMSELPVVSWLLAKIGLLTDTFMRKYRKHAVVIILVLSAVITPSGDAFTLFLVFVPIYFFYELSIWIVKRTIKNKAKRLPAG
jgi:sec-independent protein translocase protein TatC